MYLFKFTVDKELKILHLNDDRERTAKKIMSEISGIPYFHILPRIVRKGGDAVEQAISDGKPVNLSRYEVVCFCGVTRADISIEPMRDRDSRITGAEVTVKALPDCLLSRELNDSKTLIDIGKASAGLAHGVRNPLNAIKGSIVYLKGRYGNDPAFMEFSEIIEDEINKLDKFISKFLSGSLHRKKPMETDVTELLDKIVKMLSMQADTKRIAFLRRDGDIPLINTDYFQLEHAILNIMNNSIESIHDSGAITIRTQLTDLNGVEHVTVEISDSGRGFENKEAARVLKRESNSKGRGFGLFLTHEIIKNLGGFLEITSTKMVGTTVRIHIPKEMPWRE